MTRGRAIPGSCPECGSSNPSWRHFRGCSLHRQQTRDRVTLFLAEQEALGRPDSYEIWASTQRPDHVITLDDLRTLMNDTAS